MERFDVASFYQQEKEIKDSMTKCYPRHCEMIDDKPTQIIEFPNFKIISRQKPGEPTELLKIVSGDKEFDILSELPSDHKLFISDYPFAKFNYEKKELNTSRIINFGNLISLFHEISHIISRLNLQPEELDYLNKAREEFLTEKISTECRELIIKDEMKAWEGAKSKIADIEKILGIEIFPDKNDLEKYIERRIGTYIKI